MLKRLIAAFAAVAVAGTLAFAASITITGTNSENRFSILQMGIPRITRDETITATASGSITTAYQLTAGISYVTTVATTGDAVKLPNTIPSQGAPAGGGLMMTIINAGANSLNVFPFASGDTINAGSAGAAYAVASGKTAICFVGIDNKWFCVVSA